jgi:hypothetical protein
LRVKKRRCVKEDASGFFENAGVLNPAVIVENA